MKGNSITSKQKTRSLRRSTTDAELRLWQFLRNRSLQNLKFRQQHPLGPYIVDFVCLDRKLIIELDGSQHINQVEYDSIRTDYLVKTGFRVIRFWDNDVLTQTESVSQAIYDALGHPSASLQVFP